jgi:hypothetical protein
VWHDRGDFDLYRSHGLQGIFAHFSADRRDRLFYLLDESGILSRYREIGVRFESRYVGEKKNVETVIVLGVLK